MSPGRPARSPLSSGRPRMWAASAARIRASKPSPLSMAARAMRSVRAKSRRSRAACAPASNNSGLPPPPTSRSEAMSSVSSWRRPPDASARARARVRSRRAEMPRRTTSPKTGWAIQTWSRRPSMRLVMSPRSSSDSTAVASASSSRAGWARGSPTAVSSSTCRSASVSVPSRMVTSSTSRAVGRRGPRRRHTPLSSDSAPLSRAPTTSSCRKRGSPRERSATSRMEELSTGPPSTATSRSSMA